jgi:anti-sigma factor RsiW
MINRNNYEEYLLMYLDGELSSSERRSVELFLEENPDLKEELELLQQTILQPEEQVIFAGKEALYRKEAGISLNNYQDYFSFIHR